MTDNDAETMCSHCYPLNDVIDDLEATPCPVPVQRVEPRSINVKSSIGRGDTRWPDLPDTLSLTSPDSTPLATTPLATTPTRTTTSAPDATLAPDSRAPRTATSDVIPAPRATTPDTTPAPESYAPTLDSHASDATPAPDSHAPAPRDTTLAPDSPAPFDLLVELDIQQRHEERAVQLMDEYAVQFVEEDERAARERLQHAVKVYEQVSSDEEAVARWQAAEDCRPQELYIVQRARLLNKRRSNHEHQHEYPAKRGGDSTDALVVVRYPYIDTEFTVRRFGIQEMDTRHGDVLKFRRAWLLDYHAELRGYHVEGKRWSNIRLYCADQIYRAQLADVYEELYYVDLHFRSKFYATFGKKQPAIEPPKHYQAWCTFVDTYIKANTREANAYEKSLRDREECFYNTSVAGVAMKIHALSLKMRMSCTVPVDVECPSCYSESSRAVIGAQPPSDLAVLHARLQDILKQRRTTTPAPIEHGVVGRLEDEVNKLRADNIKLQARNESLQLNITAEVAVQLSQHFLSMANNVLSNNSSC